MKPARVDELVGMFSARKELEDPRAGRRNHRFGFASGQGSLHDDAGSEINDETNVADSALLVLEFLNSGHALAP